jgi:hypothetical protein
MNLTTTQLGIFGLPLAGMTGICLGVALLLAGRGGRWRNPLGLLVLLVLSVSAGAAAFFHCPGTIWIPLATLAALWVVGWSLRTPYPRHLALGLCSLVAHPPCQALVLVLLGVSAILAQAGWTAFEEQSASQELVELCAAESKPDLVEQSVRAFTDDGVRIALFAVADPAAFCHTAESEQIRYRDRSLALRLIRTAEPHPACNCHGWVFTGGRFWVKGESVEQILSGNRYACVSNPRVDDVAIYRDTDGKVLHTARVRAVLAEGQVLLESKWGQMGRFIHAPADQPYSTTWEYYRTARGSHVLRGLEGSGPGSYPPKIQASPWR